MRFIIIGLLPAEPSRRIDAQRRRICGELGSSEALRYPVHVTLRTGLACPDQEAESLAARFLAHAATHDPIPVETEGVFASSYRGGKGDEHGIIGHTVRMDEKLLGLHRFLLLFTEAAKGEQRKYAPHVSLSYGDIDGAQASEAYVRMRDSEKNERFAWNLDNVTLCAETGGLWKVYARTGLGHGDADSVSTGKNRPALP